MDKLLEVSDMPVLTDAEHARLRAMENELRVNLGKCVSGYSIRDQDAAFEYLGTAAVNFYDFFYQKYSKHPDQTYRPHWRPASEKFAYQRVVRCMGNLTALEFFLNGDSRSARLRKTISDNAALQEPQLIKAFVDSPKVPMIGSPFVEAPLLTLAKSIKFLTHDPVASRRQAFVQPILDDKGWSIYDWAKKANVSHHTASDYFKNKRKTQPYNRKKLADALSVQYQQFPK